ncbi:hypothetical protein I306_00499 [Cryptococcus gattii EJB2]|uniref:Uncharacterized protein n=1 Tax=Cryptococcus gattii EJB2 TaxID=1296103 RepID=A0ABR5C3F9_9TREE|nr:hypothetical protein I306_00499 [Cryptococcus gattii EJB2]
MSRQTATSSDEGVKQGMGLGC